MREDRPSSSRRKMGFKAQTVPNKQENEGIAWMTEEGFPMKNKLKEPTATAISTQGGWLRRSREGSDP